MSRGVGRVAIGHDYFQANEVVSGFLVLHRDAWNDAVLLEAPALPEQMRAEVNAQLLVLRDERAHVAVVRVEPMIPRRTARLLR